MASLLNTVRRVCSWAFRSNAPRIIITESKAAARRRQQQTQRAASPQTRSVNLANKVQPARSKSAEDSTGEIQIGPVTIDISINFDPLCNTRKRQRTEDGEEPSDCTPSTKRLKIQVNLNLVPTPTSTVPAPGQSASLLAGSKAVPAAAHRATPAVPVVKNRSTPLEEGKGGRDVAPESSYRERDYQRGRVDRRYPEGMDRDGHCQNETGNFGGHQRSSPYGRGRQCKEEGGSNQISRTQGREKSPVRPRYDHREYSDAGRRRSRSPRRRSPRQDRYEDLNRHRGYEPVSGTKSRWQAESPHPGRYDHSYRERDYERQGGNDPKSFLLDGDYVEYDGYFGILRRTPSPPRRQQYHQNHSTIRRRRRSQSGHGGVRRDERDCSSSRRKRHSPTGQQHDSRMYGNVDRQIDRQRSRSPRGRARTESSQRSAASGGFRRPSQRQGESMEEYLERCHDKIIRYRAEQVQKLKLARYDLESHRNKFKWMRRCHECRDDPGLPDWDPDWTLEELDIAHLRHAMHLTGVVIEVEREMKRVIDLCAKGGVEPLREQTHNFSRHDGGYTSGEEQACVDSAPHGQIANWLEQLPQDVLRLAGRVPEASTSNPAPYPDEHMLEWPDGMDLTCGPDLQPYDTFSCFDSELGERIARPGVRGEGIELILEDQPVGRNLGERCDWGATSEVREKMKREGAMMLRSHMC